LVRADITDADLEVDGHKVNWKTVEKKNADGDVLDVDGEVVTNRETQTPATIEVNRFWKTDEDGRYLYVDADPSYEVLDGKAHVMTYWIEDETEEGGFAFQKYTAEDEKKNPANKEGEYVLVGGEKVLAIRDKQFADINWDIAADNKFFKIYGDNSGLSMDSAKEYRKTLVKALSTLLYPLIDLVDFMLNSGELNIYGVAHLKGADGYQNAIYPLLQVMGCDADRNDLKTPAEYKAEADVDKGGSRLNLLTNILNPLFSRLNNILLGSEGNASSFGFGKVILNTLPNLAIFIENGGIQKLVGELIYPIGNIVDTLLGVISKNKTDLFNVVFDTFVSADALEPLHTNKDFKGTGLTERIIEKLIVAVFNPTAKTDAAGKIDNDVLQWANVHDNIYKLASTFLKEDKDSDEPKLYLTVNDDGELEVHNIILSRTTKNDDGEEETTKYPLPVVKIPSINTLLDNLAKLGAPIPWSNIVDGEDLNDGNSAEGIQRRTDAFVDVWSFIWSIVENNFDKDATNTEDLFLNQLVDGFLKDLMGEDLFETASPYLKTVLSRDSGRVLTAFIQATNDLSVADINYDSTWDKYFAANNNDKGAVVYPIKNHKESTAEIDEEGNERYDSEDVNKILNGLSGIAQSVVSAITDKTISELSVDLIFTDNIVATIAQAICSIASNDVAKAFLPLLDIDLSFDTFIGKLREYGYSDLAREVQKYNVAGKDLADIKWFVQATDD
ncbi:MAG: hypothetical protein K2K42_03620, partial [Eubacterium sp.]|nr:hypothetical protein [Eubacterium sp.]